MNFQEELKRLVGNQKKPKLIIAKAESAKKLAKVIATHLKDDIKKYIALLRFDCIYVSTSFHPVANNFLVVSIAVSFDPNYEDFVEVFHVKHNSRDFSPYGDKKEDIYTKGQIVQELENILKNDGFTSIITNKAGGHLSAVLNLT